MTRAGAILCPKPFPNVSHSSFLIPSKFPAERRKVERREGEVEMLVQQKEGGGGAWEEEVEDVCVREKRRKKSLSC